MVFKLQLWPRFRLQAIKYYFVLMLLVLSHSSYGSLLTDAQSFYESGQYFKAARYAFAASEENHSLQPVAYSWITISLIHAGLYHSASYFFIRTLQTADRGTKQRVLLHTQDLLVRVGADLFRNYLIRHTTYEDYDASNRSAYLYALGKEALLHGKAEKAIGYVNGMSTHSPLWVFALQIRGTAYAILGKNEDALTDFRSCSDKAPEEDLRSRCIAGEARTLYQMDRFNEADQKYEDVKKSSFVWTDTLFEQAWTSFAKDEYNRTLGRLVSYKSPLLSFVFNSEIEVLRAQAYLVLCLYSDANEVVNAFNAKYAGLGEEVKRYVEKNPSDLQVFYSLGKTVLKSSLHTQKEFHKIVNRFVRAPYFQNQMATESSIKQELQAIHQFDLTQPGVSHNSGQGLPGFLNLVLSWRQKSVQILGGAFVKNSLIDYHSTLISDFEKMAFIKLEMLSRAKHRLVYKEPSAAERSRGNHIPTRRDDQYYWSFNGEFWNDELGDYIFGLESECGKS